MRQDGVAVEAAAPARRAGGIQKLTDASVVRSPFIHRRVAEMDALAVRVGGPAARMSKSTASAASTFFESESQEIVALSDNSSLTSGSSDLSSWSSLPRQSEASISMVVTVGTKAQAGSLAPDCQAAEAGSPALDIRRLSRTAAADRETHLVGEGKPGPDLWSHISAGSRLHDSGRCKPCAWVTARRGCRDGVRCAYCHAIHSKVVRRCSAKANPTPAQRVGTAAAAGAEADQELPDLQEFPADGTAVISLAHLAGQSLKCWLASPAAAPLYEGIGIVDGDDPFGSPR